MSHSKKETKAADFTLTPAAERAVRLLVENPGIPARSFGHLMWPGHWAHNQWAGKGKQGVARGRAMWLKAGSYLWHLQRLGLVLRWNDGGPVWYASEEGRRVLEQSDEGPQGEKEGETNIHPGGVDSSRPSGAKEQQE